MSTGLPGLGGDTGPVYVWVYGRALAPPTSPSSPREGPTLASDQGSRTRGRPSRQRPTAGLASLVPKAMPRSQLAALQPGGAWWPEPALRCVPFPVLTSSCSAQARPGLPLGPRTIDKAKQSPVHCVPARLGGRVCGDLTERVCVCEGPAGAGKMPRKEISLNSLGFSGITAGKGFS